MNTFLTKTTVLLLTGAVSSTGASLLLHKNETPKETPVITEETIPTPTPTPEIEMQSLGQFRLTAYCNCSKCCGKWAGGPTASGTMPKEGRTIAVDTKVIPLGTKVVFNENTYTAEDTGSAIKGKRIDVFYNSHSEAMNHGVKYKEVFIRKG